VSKAKLAIALSTLCAATVVWAVPKMGAAHQLVQRKSLSSVAPIRLRDDREHGLLAKGWINGAGPFVFVIDTGAGASLISRRVVDEAKLQVKFWIQRMCSVHSAIQLIYQIESCARSTPLHTD
jgi:hypothetical protein